MAIKHLTDNDFDAFIGDGGGAAVVDFWASWCGPCRMFGPVFEAASEKYADVRFGKYELTDENKRMAAKFGVRSIPTVLAFKNGELLDTKVGLMDESAFAEWIKGVVS